MKALLLLLVAACDSESVAEKVTDPCSGRALKLGTATPAPVLKLPEGCSVKAGTSPRHLVGDAARAALDCKDPKVKLPDFGKIGLVIETSSWSPAQIGLDAWDDGKVFTIVRKQRSPCKGDPQPMPTPAITSVFFTNDANARTFGQAACTVPTSCK
jgi:hypothetical protein